MKVLWPIKWPQRISQLRSTFYSQHKQSLKTPITCPFSLILATKFQRKPSYIIIGILLKNSSAEKLENFFIKLKKKAQISLYSSFLSHKFLNVYKAGHWHQLRLYEAMFSL